ncbi:MAG: tRNA (cytidine(34)-2'-O)-methyltransferase, partial [Xanthomonadales bacterium]|nr:tRNA (cytidine(34)-2'-O)-methyltransferase [Xanthomonadales bacterium]
MLHVILYQPEIPPNTGNAIRLCANSGAQLHLIRPLGFELDDKRLRRAGLDYHEYAHLKVHDDLSACLRALEQPRLFAFTKFATRWHSDAAFADGDALLFGCETAGLPAAVMESVPVHQRLRQPMQAHSRSMNLSNAVAVA